MNRSAKILALLICISLCTIGVLLSPKQTAKDGESKTQIVPVNNQQSHRGVWLRV
jgi:hypothetical protein